jgi:hypothetical protein
MYWYGSGGAVGTGGASDTAVVDGGGGGGGGGTYQECTANNDRAPD